MSGKIYRVWNDVNGSSYIGATFSVDIGVYEYRFMNGRTHIENFNDDIKKFGKQNFHFEILHDNVSSDTEIHELKRQEIKTFDSINNGYNRKYGSGLVKHTLESRMKISEGNTGKKRTAKHRKQISKGNTGRKHTLEARMKISKAHKGRVSPNKGRKMKPEIVKRVADARRSVAWKEQEKVCEMYIERKMPASEICKIYNCSNSLIYKILKFNKIKTRKGHGGYNVRTEIWEHASEICELYVKSNMRSHEIADKFNANYRTIIRILEDNNVKRYAGRRTKAELAAMG